MDIIWMSFSTLIKPEVWIPFAVGLPFVVLSVSILWLCYHPNTKITEYTISNVNQHEIQRQLARQTDIMERNRWDRLSSRKPGDY